VVALESSIGALGNTGGKASSTGSQGIFYWEPGHLLLGAGGPLSVRQPVRQLQAGEAAIRQVVTDAGFTRFRRAAETPFNLVYEVRP
jgi:hypothetical protein